MASVPDSEVISQEAHVKAVIGPYDDLGDLFAHSVDKHFDPRYKGAKDSLGNFRNYNDAVNWYQRTVNRYNYPSLTESIFSGWMHLHGYPWSYVRTASVAEEYNAHVFTESPPVPPNFHINFYLKCGASYDHSTLYHAYRTFLRFTELHDISNIYEASIWLPVYSCTIDGINVPISQLDDIPTYLPAYDYTWVDFRLDKGTYAGSVWDPLDWDEYDSGINFFDSGWTIEVRTMKFGPDQSTDWTTIYYVVKTANTGQRFSLLSQILANDGYVDMVMRNKHYDVVGFSPTDDNNLIFKTHQYFNGYEISPELHIRYS